MHIQVNIIFILSNNSGKQAKLWYLLS